MYCILTFIKIEIEIKKKKEEEELTGPNLFSKE